MVGYTGYTLMNEHNGYIYPMSMPISIIKCSDSRVLEYYRNISPVYR